MTLHSFLRCNNLLVDDLFSHLEPLATCCKPMLLMITLSTKTNPTRCRRSDLSHSQRLTLSRHQKRPARMSCSFWYRPGSFDSTLAPMPGRSVHGVSCDARIRAVASFSACM